MRLIILIISTVFASEVDLQILNNGNSNCIIALNAKKNVYGMQLSIHYNHHEIIVNNDAFLPLSDNIRFYKSFHDSGVVQLLVLGLEGEMILDTARVKHLNLINITFQRKKEFNGTSIVNFSDIEVAGKAGMSMNLDTDKDHSIELSFVLPTHTLLHGNDPNPFSEFTKINYALSDSNIINLFIYNSNGVLVRNLFEGFQKAGYYNVLWDGLDSETMTLPNGHYTLQISTYNFVDSITMTLLK